MEITFKNTELVAVFNLLVRMGGKGRKARAISKFTILMQSKIEEYASFEKDLLKEYCVCDEFGEVVLSEDGKYTFIDSNTQEGLLALKELQEEICVIDLTEFSPFLEYLIEALEESDLLLAGREALAYDLLMDKLEFIKKEVNENAGD